MMWNFHSKYLDPLLFKTLSFDNLNKLFEAIATCLLMFACHVLFNYVVVISHLKNTSVDIRRIKTEYKYNYNFEFYKRPH